MVVSILRRQTVKRVLKLALPLMIGCAAGSATASSVPTPQALMQLVAASPLLMQNKASLDVAQSRLDYALSALKPRLTGRFDARRMDSMQDSDTRNSDVLGTLEVVQPVYDFGRSYSDIAAARADLKAQAIEQDIHRNTLVLEGLALYYELHASDLEVQALQEDNTIAFFQATRLADKDVVGDANPIEILEARARSESARYKYTKARNANLGIRLRLEELTGQSFTETTLTPLPPDDAVFQVDTEKLVARVQEGWPALQVLAAQRDAMQSRARAAGFSPQIEAYGRVGESTRDLRGRDNWALGARLVVPFYDGGKRHADKARWLAEQRRLDARITDLKKGLVRKTHMTYLARSEARMRLLAARTAYKAGRQRLLLEQLQRTQDREASVGGATARIGHVETELVRALGAYRVAGVKLAILLGQPLNNSFEANFLEDLKVVEQ